MGMRSVETEGEGVRKIKIKIKIKNRNQKSKSKIKIKRCQHNCCEYPSSDVLWRAVDLSGRGGLEGQLRFHDWLVHLFGPVNDYCTSTRCSGVAASRSRPPYPRLGNHWS
jgi:hypothetical protein